MTIDPTNQSDQIENPLEHETSSDAMLRIEHGTGPLIVERKSGRELSYGSTESNDQGPAILNGSNPERE